jgi:uroporphyrinogen-III synthase
VLPQLLRDTGREVVDIPVYETVPPELSEAELSKLRQTVGLGGADTGQRVCDMIVITSSAAAENLVGLLHEPLLRSDSAARKKFFAIPVCAIGSKTAYTARALGFSDLKLCSNASLRALVAGIREYFAGSS